MATIITEECINCGACEPECPNTAIFQGGVEFELGGATQPALSDEIFFIVPEKCTECVGFFDYEACAAVCPVDCCVPDPDRPETEEALVQRAKELHPDKTFEAPVPSRFNPVGDTGGGGETEAAAANGAAAPAAPAAAAAAVAQPVGGAVVMGRVERAVPPPRRTLQAGDPSGDFEGELDDAFDAVIGRAQKPQGSIGSRVAGLGFLLASPVLGGLGHTTKKSLELAYGDTRYFSAQLSTALNTLFNFLLYPALAFGAGVAAGLTPFTEGDRGWITLGILFAVVETMVRFREGIFGSIPADRMRYGASVYGAPLGILVTPVINRLMRSHRSGWVPVEGFYAGEFEEKRERERRYGEVYSVHEFDGGYYVRFEMPRTIPPSAARDERGFGEEMPDYDVKLALNNGSLTVTGSIVDPDLRAVCGVSPAFPADFKTEVELEGPLSGFRHRYSDKTLEIAVLKHGT